MIHIASVWVPFTSESKEAVASYPEIQKELRLGLQAVGRKLGMYLRRRLRVRQEGERRNLFLRYIGEVATAVCDINAQDRQAVYDQLMLLAKKRTAEADVKLDERGKPIDEEELELGENVLIVDPNEAAPLGVVINAPPARAAKGDSESEADEDEPSAPRARGEKTAKKAIAKPAKPAKGRKR